MSNIDDDSAIIIPREVIHWQNDEVMVFDEAGEPIPSLQGRYEEMREKILAAADELTQFWSGQWQEMELAPVTRETF